MISTKEKQIKKITNLGKPVWPETVIQGIFDLNSGVRLGETLKSLQDQIDEIEVDPGGGAQWGSIQGDILSQTDLQEALNDKVDVTPGLQLSQESFTTLEKNKLQGLQPQVNADWSSSSGLSQILNKPGWIGASKPAYTKSEVGLGNVDNTSDLAKPVSTATQTALNGKADVLNIPQNNVSYRAASGSGQADGGLLAAEAPTANSIALRGANGVLQVGDAVAANQAVAMGQVNSLIEGVVESEIDNQTISLSTLPGYNAGVKQYLTHDASGNLSWESE